MEKGDQLAAFHEDPLALQPTSDKGDAPRASPLPAACPATPPLPAHAAGGRRSTWFFGSVRGLPRACVWVCSFVGVGTYFRLGLGWSGFCGGRMPGKILS